MPRQFRHVFRHRRALGLQKIIHRPRQSLMRDQMGAVGLDRQIAAQQFVFALRAGFDLFRPRAMAKSIAW